MHLINVMYEMYINFVHFKNVYYVMQLAPSQPVF
jgi:hypothetical protein